MLSPRHMHTTMAGRLAGCASCYPPCSVEMNVTSSRSLSSESSCPLQHQHVTCMSAKAHHSIGTSTCWTVLRLLVTSGALCKSAVSCALKQTPLRMAAYCT